MAVVGAMAGLRLYLIKPIFDKVLRPEDQNPDFLLYRVPWTHRSIDLHFLVPSHFHNAWSVVAYALIASALLKSVCDYGGTYLVNYAGFGMITDLRNDLYDAVLRRSVAFFQQHSTGMLLSTIINDIERVQFAMSTIMADFLQQFFTLAAMICIAVSLWREAGVGATALFAGGGLVGAAHRAQRADNHAHGTGQAGGDTEHPARDDHRKRHCEGVRDGACGRWTASATRGRLLPRKHRR